VRSADRRSPARLLGLRSPPTAAAWVVHTRDSPQPEPPTPWSTGSGSASCSALVVRSNNALQLSHRVCSSLLTSLDQQDEQALAAR
jgi:hypothetical protein